MDQNQVKKCFRHVWGWFTICVWIGGVPQVVSLAYSGIMSTAHAVKCEVADCSADREAQMGEFTSSEWRAIMNTKEAKDVLAKKKQ